MVQVVVDVEANGPILVHHSMVSFAAVVVEPGFQRTFSCGVAPISPYFVPAAVAVHGITLEEQRKYERPDDVLPRFHAWLHGLGGQPVFWSDNPAFDWQFMNYYLHVYASGNPFGHSARRIGDLYCGLVCDLRANRKWKNLRQTRHSHHPLDDARGNAEALLKIFEMLEKRASPRDSVIT